MKVSAGLPTGVAALLFEAARHRRELEERLAGHLLAAGFAEVILPILDYAEPYEPLLSPAARSELYRFVGRDGELLALRADFTPLLARLLAPRLGSLALPLRLFYRGDVVRHGEERFGRPRELYQLGAELVGEAGEAAEGELLGLFLELISQAVAGGPGPVQVVLGFAGALDQPLLRAAGGTALALAAAVARRQRGPLRGAPGVLLEVVERGVPRRGDDLGPEAAARLDALFALRRDLGPQFPHLEITVDLAEFAGQTLDPRLAPEGLAGGERPYYDGIVFRAHAGPAGVEIGGGGRYDRLFRALGADVPALGFSLGLDRLAQRPGLESQLPRPLTEGAPLTEVAEPRTDGAQVGALAGTLEEIRR